MLTQMESFPGIFIASTNLMDDLDQAALRRFDLKLKFDFLLSDQAWSLFNRCCTALELTLPENSLKRTLDRLSNATPGDFAAIMRRHRFKPLQSAHEMISILADECRLKEGSSRSIGFI